MDNIIQIELIKDRIYAAQNVWTDDSNEMWVRERAHELFCHWKETLELVRGSLDHTAWLLCNPQRKLDPEQC